jgi:G:T-mismatch repair DNA endonuclease (very short patch repair protein)
LKSDLLRETGWNVLTVWECQIEKNVDICVKKVLSAVRRT